MNESDTWAILASGPSMSQEVADSVRGLNVIAISNTYELAPWADVLVSNDRRWWMNYSDALKFQGEKYCGLCIDAPKGVTKFHGAISGSNSGLLALMVAVKKGAKRILLFGYDMGGSHYFGDHAHGLPNPSQKRFESFKKQFAGYKPSGVQIINCTPGSALKCYPFGDAKELIPQPPEPPPEPPQGERGEKGEPGESIVGPRGPKGDQGEQGPIGPMPDHQWDGTRLRFEEPDGDWGKYVDLRGPIGLPGAGGGGGGRGMTPDQQLQLNTLLDIFGGWIGTVPVAVIDEVSVSGLEVSVEGSATGFYPTYPPAPAGFVGAEWEWNWGDGSISTTQNASHTYDEDGTYTITFRAKNHIGWSATVTEEVNVAGGTEWTPVALPSIYGWITADDPANTYLPPSGGSSFDAISEFNDKAGTGISIIPSWPRVNGGVDISNLYFERNGSINGRSAMKNLAGSPNRYGEFDIGDGAFARNKAGVTLAAVFKPNAASMSGSISIIAANVAAAAFIRAYLGVEGGSILAGGRRQDGDSLGYVLTYAVTQDVPVVLVAIIDYANNRVFLRVNGEQVGQNLNAWPTAGNSADTEGLSTTFGHQEGLNGYGVYGELVMSQTAVGTTDAEKLEGYLAWQWDLESELPVGHPYKSAPPAL